MDDLKVFIATKMRMSHVYQPVMLMTLLENGGRCQQEDIAKALLSYDLSQIEYYTRIVNNMVGRVLRSHGIVTKHRKEFQLEGFDQLSDTARAELIQLCQTKIADFIASRGARPWQHRKQSLGYIPGTIRYEVLKRAKYRCELCGVSAEDKAIEVDHIVPRNHGGSDDLSNLQALCYTCNAMKRDRDDTDFRQVRASYDHREDGCLFCHLPADKPVVAENELAYVIRDGFPVTHHHSLIIPKRHVATYFELGQAEVNACNQLLQQQKSDIQRVDETVTAFNIGMNAGEDAGQTIFHCHIHLVPRRKGDVESPRGGVRHLIPGRGNY